MSPNSMVCVYVQSVLDGLHIYFKKLKKYIPIIKIYTFFHSSKNMMIGGMPCIATKN